MAYSRIRFEIQNSATMTLVQYVKLDVGGKTMVEIDKYNSIARFGDTDALESLRKDLGLA